MTIQLQLSLTTTVAEINSTFVVYMHMDPSDMAIKYIGHCALPDVLTFEDARCNSLWPDIFLPPGKQISISIYSTHATEAEAIAAARKLALSFSPLPICNAKGYRIAPHRQDIICNETGERWKTVRECAASHNLTASALSNHLNGKTGHRTVKGRTYRRTV